MISDHLNWSNILESKVLLSKYHPEVLKMSILSNPSQSPKELTEADFTASEKQLYYFYKTLNNIKNFANENSKLNESIALHGRIIKPDMVNAALAISEFPQVFKYANTLLNNANENPLHKLTTLNKLYENIISAANSLGLFMEEPEVFILEIKEKYINLNHIDMIEVKELMNQRQEAKSEKNYQLSDELKDKLEQKGIIVRDSPFGSEWDIKALYISR